jgi:hypothetical protein
MRKGAILILSEGALVDGKVYGFPIDSDDEYDELLAESAMRGISDADLRPLAEYLQRSPRLDMNAGLKHSLLSLLEKAENVTDERASALAIVKAPNAKRAKIRRSKEAKQSETRLRAMAGFIDGGGRNRGCYEAGMISAASTAEISEQRAKQLLTPQYREAFFDYIDSIFDEKPISIDMQLAINIDHIRIGPEKFLIINPDKTIEIANLKDLPPTDT